MALHIVKSATDVRLQEEFSQPIRLATDADLENDVSQRVTRNAAERYLLEWKKIVLSYERLEEGNLENIFTQGNGMQTRLIDGEDTTEVDKLQDKLFIVTGEDSTDIFRAFDHYGLDYSISTADRANIQL